MTPRSLQELEEVEVAPGCAAKEVTPSVELGFEQILAEKSVFRTGNSLTKVRNLARGEAHFVSFSSPHSF